MSTTTSRQIHQRLKAPLWQRWCLTQGVVVLAATLSTIPGLSLGVAIDPVDDYALTSANAQDATIRSRERETGVLRSPLALVAFSNLTLRANLVATNQAAQAKELFAQASKGALLLPLITGAGLSASLVGALIVYLVRRAAYHRQRATKALVKLASFQDIVAQVEQAATQVNTTLGENEGAICQLHQEALQQAEQTRCTLEAVEQMNHLMQAVAQNAQQATAATRTAANTALAGGMAIERSVQNILSLRTAMIETVKTVNRLGESSQEIAQALSGLEAIAVPTNPRMDHAEGNAGQHLSAIASLPEQLALQPVAAIQDLVKRVGAIQHETHKVAEVVKQSTMEVVAGTRFVGNAKQSLDQILEVSTQVDLLVHSIYNATISQVKTTQAIAALMKEMTQASERTAHTSCQVSSSLQRTAAVSQQLQTALSTLSVEHY